MRLFRGPRTTRERQETDKKSPSEIAREWELGGALWFDGTIDKTGHRHTRIGVELDRADIWALLQQLLKHDRERSERLEKELAEREREIQRLKGGLAKIRRLAILHYEKAPSWQAFREAIVTLAREYHWNYRDKEPSLSLRWIDARRL